MLVRGFDPVARPDALVLILGTIPSRESLAAGEYYANKRNAFWFIVGRLFGAGEDVTYQGRSETLLRHRVAMWDVLSSAQRAGSSDSAIVPGTEEPNDFDRFFRAHREIQWVFFNGGKAGELYRALVVPRLSPPNGLRPQMRRLPSTSPANALMTKEEKLKRWHLVKHALVGG